ncbi:hypothetical protein [Heliothis virescens ascovirus 3j]|uniref:Uncharacterized protein n=1 Tax=Heliothis virescens ascovirus 3j TaxID=1561067 RepID=A0A2Z5UZ83_9VIRU|nr:hypothetical protein [Heliothis virescens ascovirus 3j]
MNTEFQRIHAMDEFDTESMRQRLALVKSTRRSYWIAGLVVLVLISTTIVYLAARSTTYDVSTIVVPAPCPAKVYIPVPPITRLSDIHPDRNRTAQLETCDGACDEHGSCTILQGTLVGGCSTYSVSTIVPVYNSSNDTDLPTYMADFKTLDGRDCDTPCVYKTYFDRFDCTSKGYPGICTPPQYYDDTIFNLGRRPKIYGRVIPTTATYQICDDDDRFLFQREQADINRTLSVYESAFPMRLEQKLNAQDVAVLGTSNPILRYTMYPYVKSVVGNNKLKVIEYLPMSLVFTITNRTVGDDACDNYDAGLQFYENSIYRWVHIVPPCYNGPSFPHNMLLATDNLLKQLQNMYIVVDEFLKSVKDGYVQGIAAVYYAPHTSAATDQAFKEKVPTGLSISLNLYFGSSSKNNNSDSKWSRRDLRNMYFSNRVTDKCVC